MHGEISKRPFGEEEERKHRQSVNMQMGRVQLDSDWNEAFEILLRSGARALKDIVGKHGSPNDGFRIGPDLVLDHLESKEGWTFSGSGSWKIASFEKIEGNGSFRIEGDGRFERKIPELLRALSSLRALLVARGAVVVSSPKLLLHYKVAAAGDAMIQVGIAKAGGLGTLATDPAVSYPCDGWQVLALQLPETSLSGYDTLFIHVQSSGTVFLDCLAVDPGLLAEDAHDDFYIQGGDGTVDGAGRYYVAGLACVKEGFETYLIQADYPEAPALALHDGEKHLAYLDAWKRTITRVEDPAILEVALNGPDTCTREQLVAQVKVIPAADCCADINALKRPNPTGALTAKLAPKAEQAECDFRPELDYTGLDNSLYRIEIHTGGDESSAVFKWSRNNGADLVPIIGFDPDNVSVLVPEDRLLCRGDSVELCDDVSDLCDFADTAQQGKLAKILDITAQPDGFKITLDISTATFKAAGRVDAGGLPLRHPKLRKWHGVEDVGDYLDMDLMGTPVKELEHGIRLAFSEGHYYPGDYWQFTARVNTRAIEELDLAPPLGPEHHYAPLALIYLDAGKMAFDSCRKVFPPLTGIRAGDISVASDTCPTWAALGVENLQQVIELYCRHPGCCDQIVLPGQSIQQAINRIGPEGGSICLASGIHVVTKTIHIHERRNITIRGTGAATRIIYVPIEPETDPDRIKALEEMITSKEADIKTAREAGDEASAKEHRGTRRELLKKQYEARGLADEESALEAQIDEIIDQMEEAGNDPELLKELQAKLDALRLELARIRSEGLHDLFRVTASRNISLEDLLMLAFDADSLVAILEDDRAVRVSGCDLFNLPAAKNVAGVAIDRDLIKELRDDIIRKQSELFRVARRRSASEPEPQKAAAEEKTVPDRIEVEGKSESETIHRIIGVSRDRKALTPCVRITRACDVRLENNRMLADVVIVQQGDYDAGQVPVLNGLVCRGNRIYSTSWGVLLIECRHAAIERNEILDLAMSLSTEERQTLRELVLGLALIDQLCPAKSNQQVNQLIDALSEFVFGCTPEMPPTGRMTSVSLTAFVLRESRIERNTVAGRFGVHLFFSKGNKILGNRIYHQAEAALTLVYSLNTRVRGNLFETAEPVSKSSQDDERPQGIPFQRPEPAPKRFGAMSEKTTGDQIISSFLQAQAVVEVHYCDRLKFQDNQVQGPKGWVTAPLTMSDFTGIIEKYALAWNTLFAEEAMVLLAKRFTTLMGLGPTINLLETLLEVFSGGYEVDWIASLLGQSSTTGGLYQKITPPSYKASGTLPASLWKNPFLTLLAKGFLWLLSMKLVSRTIITGNRFSVDSLGIAMDDAVTLGGTRVAANRICGAARTAILWYAPPLFCNPELNGVLLGCTYEVILIYLNFINSFLKMLVAIIEGEQPAGGQTISPILVFLAMAMLYGVGQTCPEREETPAGEGETEEPENPYVEIINGLIEALGELLKQLQDDDVRRAVADLASSDDRIRLNQIRGKGVGIHTNIANCVIAANRIDLEGGKAAVAELFSMGRFLATHASVLYQTDESGALIDHSAVAALGHALMILNPYALFAAHELLQEKPDQWKGLADVLEGLRQIAPDASITKDLYQRVDTLLTRVAAPDFAEAAVKAASAGLLSGLYKHLGGYGMLLESPGIQVVDNRVEAAEVCPLAGEERRASGGILMTAGTGLRNILVYYLLLEEALPLANLGGQGTRFTGNSIQWGTGHAINLSTLPAMADVRIEHNEIQNHGLAGIVCDKTSFSLPLYKLRLINNEINQCFLNQAAGISLDFVPAVPTILGGLTVRSASEVYCFGNHLRLCGKVENGWPAFGSVLVDCWNVKYDGNEILDNGRQAEAGSLQELYFPRGGALFLGSSGHLSVLNNKLSGNNGLTLLVHAKYTLSFYANMPYFGFLSEAWQPSLYPQSLAWLLKRCLVVGNVFEISDASLSPWAKIHAGNPSALDSLLELTFSQNQVALPDTAAKGWYSVFLSATRLLFSGNMVTGHESLDPVSLYAVKGMAAGNVLFKNLNVVGVIEEHNVI